MTAYRARRIIEAHLLSSDMFPVGFMTDTRKTIFLSYRRSVTRYLALLIFQTLRARGYDVFWDIEGIGSGHFDTIILSQIEAREHFVVLLAHGTLDRCDEPGDWLRREIEHAIQAERNLVPVLVDGFTLDVASQYLTGGMSTLPRYNATNLYFDFFEAGIDRLCAQFLTEHATRPVRPAPPEFNLNVAQIMKDAAQKAAPTADELNAEKLFIQAVGKQTRGDIDGALAAYDHVIRLLPELPEPYYNRGVARTQRGDIAGAIADYTAAIQRDHTQAATYNNRGLAYANSGDLEKAIADYSQALALNPDLSAAYKNRAAAFANLGQSDQAIADFSAAIQRDPDDPSLYNNRGTEWDKRGDLDKAIADYTESIRCDPDQATPYYNRGTAHSNNSDLDSAIADFTEAIHRNPYLFAAYVNRGSAYNNRGDLDKAIEDYSEVLRRNPNQVEAYYNRGIAHNRNGDLDAAVADYDQALRLNPAIPEAYVNRGEIAFRREDYYAAMADFQTADNLRPGFRFALAGLAITHLAQGNETDAHRLWRTLVDADPRYHDLDWIIKEHEWPDSLANHARTLIAAL